MNREIKFRVWDVDGKEFVGDMCLHIDGSILCDHGTTGYVGEFIIQQYTGLNDKNGKEIYEGDIVKFTIEKDYGIVDYEISEVKWWKHSWIIFDGFGHYPVEVIGNIYENPELLNNTPI